MPFNLLAQLIILAVTVVIGKLLEPKAKRQKPAPFEAPKAEDGAPIAKFYGIAQVPLNIVGCWAIAKDAPASGLTKYYAKMQGLLGYGPVDVFYNLIASERAVSLQPLSASQSLQGGRDYIADPPFPMELTGDGPQFIDLNARQMFGGQTQGGGLQGEMRFYRGTEDQPQDSVITQYLGPTNEDSRYPHIAYIVFGAATGDTYISQLGELFYLTANQPNPEAISVIVGCYPDALLNNGGRIGLNANLVEVIYDALTSKVYGRGYSSDRFNIPQWQESAATLLEEGIGGSPVLTDKRNLSQFLNDCQTHVNGQIVTNRRTGLLEFKLARGDYDPDDLLVLTKDNTREFHETHASFGQTVGKTTVRYRRFINASTAPNVTELISKPLPLGKFLGGVRLYISSYQDLVNVVLKDDADVVLTLNVDYRVLPKRGWVMISPAVYNASAFFTLSFSSRSGFSGFKDATESAYALWHQQASQQFEEETADYVFYTEPVSALKKAIELARLNSDEVRTYKWKMSRSGCSLTECDVVLVNEPEYHLTNQVLRIVRVNYGSIPNNPYIECEAIRDPFADVIVLDGLGTGSESNEQFPQNPALAGVFCGTGAIRIGLSITDQISSFEIERSTDSIGTGATIITPAEGEPGTSTFYDDPQTVGQTRCYRVRAISPGTSPGVWSDRICCTAVGDTPVDPDFIRPTVEEMPTQTDILGTLRLIIVDPQIRVTLVEMWHQVSNQSATDPAIESAEPFEDSVDIVAPACSSVSYRVTYINEFNGAAQITGIHNFCPSSVIPPITGDATGHFFEIAFHGSMTESVRSLAVGVDWSPLSGKLGRRRVDLSQHSRCRVVDFVTNDILPEGAVIALQYIPWDNTNPDEADWAWLADEDENGIEQPQIACDTETQVPLASDYMSIALGARQDVYIRPVAMGGDGITKLGNWSLVAQFDGDLLIPPDTDDNPVVPPPPACIRGGFNAQDLDTTDDLIDAGWTLSSLWPGSAVEVDPVDGLKSLVFDITSPPIGLFGGPGGHFWTSPAFVVDPLKTYYTKVNAKVELISSNLFAGWRLEGMSNVHQWSADVGAGNYHDITLPTVTGGDGALNFIMGQTDHQVGDDGHHNRVSVRSVEVIEVECNEDGEGPNPGGGGGDDPIPPPPPTSGLRALILWNYIRKYWFDYSPFNGVLVTPSAYTPAAMIALLDSCRDAGMKIVLNLVFREDAKVGGKFNQAAYLACLNGYAGVDISSYTDVIIGIVVMDEPHLATPSGWGMVVQQSVVDGVLAKRASELFPGFILFERTSATRLEASGRVFQYITGCWNQMSGSQMNRMTVAQYMQQEKSSQGRIPTGSGIGLGRRMWGLANKGPGGINQLSIPQYRSAIAMALDTGAEGLAVWADSNPPDVILKQSGYRGVLSELTAAMV